MSSTVEERRTQEVLDQKKIAEQKTQKEKEASAAKFKSTIMGQQVAKQKGETAQKETAQKQAFNQNLLMARNGIAGRNLAERLVKNSEQSEKMEKEITNSRDGDLKADSDRVDGDSQDAKTEAQAQAQQFDGAVQQRDDEQKKGDEQNQGQQSQGQNQQQQQQGGQGQNKDGKDDKEGAIGGVGGAQKAGKVGGAGQAEGPSSATKVAVGKINKTGAADRIPQPVMQAVVDKVAVMCAQNMGEFQITLKDDMMGGGTLRVTLKDNKLKIAFTLKDASTKNLLESQKGVLMRMFERKGLALESMTVQVRQ